MAPPRGQTPAPPRPSLAPPRPRLAHRLATWVVVLLAAGLFGGSYAEGIFFHRDHHDQSFYVQNMPKFEGVTNYRQLVGYLNKYGYINCTYRREVVKRDASLPFEELGELDKSDTAVPTSAVSFAPCRRQQVRDSLKKVQLKLGLEPSGVLDGETKTVLSTVRCGNKDIDTSVAPGAVFHGGRASRIESSAPGSEEEDEDEEETKEEDDETGSDDDDEEARSDVEGSDERSDNVTAPAHTRRKRRRAVDLIASARRARDATRAAANAAPPRGGGGGAKPAGRSSRARREKMLAEMMARIRHEDGESAAGRRRRRPVRRLDRRRDRRRDRRSTPVGGPSTAGEMQNHIAKFKRGSLRPISWRLLRASYSQRLTAEAQQGMLELAFRMWSEVIPLRFQRQDHGGIDTIDVQIAFGKGQHLNCNRSFDGSGGELAHSQVGTGMHFDDDENYKVRDYDSDDGGIYFVRVAVHEIGHVLGLAHNNKRGSIMFPIYQSSFGDDLELGMYDRKSMQKLYGVCRGTFDIVFDWLRKKPREPGPAGGGGAGGGGGRRATYIFNTYFFRDDHYWMYENRASRPRYGDPLLIANEWQGIPDRADGYMQVLFQVGALYEYEIKTYFFKGARYYLYDDVNDSVMAGWPHLIADDFGPKANSTERVPDNLDAVHYDRTTSTIHFFKGKWVWTYDPKLMGEDGCCESKRLFTDLFPMADGSNTTVTGDIDEVFYSYAHHRLYIFDGETVYENVGYGSRNSLRKLAPWHDKWYDICDVE